MTMRDVIADFFDGPHATPPPAQVGPIFLGIKNITEEGRLDLTDIRHIAEDDYGEWTRRVEPRNGDLVLTYEATLHRYAMIPAGFRGCLGRRVALVRPRGDIVDARFLLYCFLGPEWRHTVQQRLNVGSTVDRLPLTDLPSFPIRIPDLPTQRKVIAVLAEYDDLIENNQRRIQILEEMARRIYHEWFVEFRYPSHSQVQFIESELGPIPEEWCVARLGNHIEFVYGKALKFGDRRPGSVTVYGSGGVIGTHDVAVGDGPGVIVGRKGNVGSVFWSDGPFFAIDTTYWIRTGLPLTYCYFALRGMQFVDTHSAVPGLSRDQAYSKPLLLPDRECSASFDAIVKDLFALRRALVAATGHLESSRDLLLPRLVSGEIDITGLDIAMPPTAA